MIKWEAATSSTTFAENSRQMSASCDHKACKTRPSARSPFIRSYAYDLDIRWHQSQPFLASRVSSFYYVTHHDVIARDTEVSKKRLQVAAHSVHVLRLINWETLASSKARHFMNFLFFMFLSFFEMNHSYIGRESAKMVYCSLRALVKKTSLVKKR